MAGRYVSFRIQPFSFREMCEYKGLSVLEVTDEHLKDYMVWGGLPQRFILEKEEQTKTFLRDVYDTIVLRDIVTSLIMTRVSRYDIRGKKILTKMDKFYLTDMGLGKIRNSGFKLEMGALLENVVLNELLFRGYEVYVGKTRNGEIDFIATKDNKREYYQVAYYLYDEQVIEREFGAFKSVPDNYPKYVLSFDKMDFSRDGIIHKNILEFLLETI